MKFVTLLIFILISASVMAQHPTHHVKDDPNEVEPFERGFPKGFQKAPPKLEVTDGIHKYAPDSKGKPQQNFGVTPIHDNQIFGFFFIDRLEQHPKAKNDTTLWDAIGRVGNNIHRLYLETEGEFNSDKGHFKKSRNEILYGYAIAPFWDIQGGYRRDFIADKDDRDFAVFSFQGMAPFEFEVDAASYLSSDGDISAILEVEYSFLLTQRTQVIPRFEAEASVQQVKEYNIGRGLNGFELGLRISHQIIREFAPYIGVSWERKTFGTKDLLEDVGEETSEGIFLIGVRMII